MTEYQHGYTPERERYIARLNRVEGQVRGLVRMISEDQYCIDILTQIAAINSALENVGLALLDDHLKHCVTGAMNDGGSGDEEALNAKVEEAMQAIKRMVKS
ncbi:metal-sensitive transcriptional regulator [Corynebacterium mayonis]|uniref:metal-sensitive transcriptional regulator n=1 Tax=Corynebacterium mayonis TaxID=3062461 RepID=UPI00313FF76D